MRINVQHLNDFLVNEYHQRSLLQFNSQEFTVAEGNHAATVLHAYPPHSLNNGVATAQTSCQAHSGNMI